jgi:hypothetical protein
VKILAIKYLTIVALLGFEAWFLWPASSAWQFEWEPLLGMIATFTAYLGIEAKDHHAGVPEGVGPAPRVNEVDRRLFSDFTSIFTPSVITFFREHDFHNTFPADPMNRLFQYTDGWSTTEHEFVDGDIQKRHQEFRDSAMTLANALAEYTRSMGSNMATVKPVDHQGGPLPDWVRNEAKELNRLASAFVESHQAFLVRARPQLA